MKWLLNAPAKLFSVIFIGASFITLLTVSNALNNTRWHVKFKTGEILESAAGELQVESIDLVQEPGEFSSNEELSLFYSRQKKFAEILDNKTLSISSESGTVSISPQKKTCFSLSFEFWIQIIVGFGATIISGWLWSLRPRDLSVNLFFLSGLSTLGFSYSAALYTTRELALSPGFFKFLVSLNVIGASLFGISTFALFLIYPRTFRYSKIFLLSQVIIFSLWTLLSVFGALPAWAGVNLITMFEMIGIIFAILLQFKLTRGYPEDRAALTWIGLSILVSAGGFIVINALPLVMGMSIPMPQGYAFVFFLLFYFGLAAGIGRFRLFEVGAWAYRLLYYMLGAAFFVFFDFVFLSYLNFEKVTALGASTFILGLCYYPLRDWIRKLLTKNSSFKEETLIQEALHVALAPTLDEKNNRWENLISQILKPLEIRTSQDNVKEVMLSNDGVELSLPGFGEIHSYILRYTNDGKSLFTKDSKNLMEQLIKLIEYADASRTTYERGVKEERHRIAQDLHDDVGARLLTGLHGNDADLRSTIQGAIGDIRTIVRGIAGGPLEFSSLIAELRSESLSRAEAKNIQVEWPVWDNIADFKVDYHIYKAISSIVRELVSNVIKHSEAKHLKVSVLKSADILEVSFEDDGKGIENLGSDKNSGFGLRNIEKRLESIGGEVNFLNTTRGVKICLRIPV